MRVLCFVCDAYVCIQVSQEHWDFIMGLEDKKPPAADVKGSGSGESSGPGKAHSSTGRKRKPSQAAATEPQRDGDRQTGTKAARGSGETGGVKIKVRAAVASGGEGAEVGGEGGSNMVHAGPKKRGQPSNSRAGARKSK